MRLALKLPPGKQTDALDLVHPRLYVEKLRWRMLYDRRPLLSTCADRVAVRDYVSERAGDDCLVPLLGVYDRPEQVPWLELAPPYVVKATHGCGWNIIVRESSDVDPQGFDQRLRRWQKTNYYDVCWEWAYKHVPRKIIVERFVGRDGKIPDDYKIHCFHGEPRVVSVYKDRFSPEAGWNRWDAEWKPLTFLSADIRKGETDPPPERLPQLLDLARALSSDFDYVRVDLYCVKDRVYFGELSTTPSGGASVFSPEGEVWMGGQWHLPERSAVGRRLRADS